MAEDTSPVAPPSPKTLRDAMVETRARITEHVNQVEARVRHQVHDTLRSGPAAARHLPAAVGILKLFKRTDFRYGLLAGAAGAILAIQHRRQRR